MSNLERWRYNFRMTHNKTKRRKPREEESPIPDRDDRAPRRAVALSASAERPAPAALARPVSRRMAIAALPSLLAACSAQKEVLRISSDGDELAFVPSRLDCTAGAQVELIFTHKGVIVSDPHDWVLLKPGTMEAFLKVADKATNDDGITDQNRRFIIARTKLCPKGQTVSLTFTAPPAGEYPFVCSVPGHGETMHGTLTTH